MPRCCPAFRSPTRSTLPRSNARFGADVATLVTGVARMDEIRALPPQGDADERAAQAETLRKMLLAMVEDIRVVLIKLAERTADPALSWSSRRRRAELRDARRGEVLDLFAPLANRLGVWQLKWELEDLACARSSPTTYKAIAQAAGRAARSTASVTSRTSIALLQRELAARRHHGRDHAAAPSTSTASGTRCGASRRRDRRALRHPRGAHTGRRHQGLLHGARHRPSPVDAAAARVRRLHREAQGQQLPFAAHGGDRARGQAARGADPHLRDAPALRIRRRRALALQGRIAEGCAAIPRSRTGSRGCARCSNGRTRSPMPRELARRVQEQSLHGHDLRADAAGQGRRPARGATPVDFAYAVHTSLGHRCRGAKVDGAMVPLNHALKNGQQVEIVAAKQGGPVARLAQSRARLRAQPPRAHQGAAVVQGAAARGDGGAGPRDRRARAARAGATALNLDAVAAKAGYDKADELFAAVARDEINLRQVQTAIMAVVQPAPPRPERDAGGRSRGRARRRARAAASSSSASTGC